MVMIEAFNRRDADAAVAFASPDVEWEASMFWIEHAQTYRGRAELRGWMNRVLEPWENIHVRAEEVTQTSDGRVFGFLRVTGRGSASGVETELQGWTVDAVPRLPDGRRHRRKDVTLRRSSAPFARTECE